MTKGGNGAKAARNSGRTAVAYFRTSSAANVGADKDTVQRQRDAVTAYAEAHGLEIVREFHDAAVSGADPIDRRPGSSSCSPTCTATAPAPSWSRTRAASRATSRSSSPGTTC